MEYLLKCSSRHCLQNLWPHFVSIGSFRGNWQIAHCKSSSTELTKYSSYPPRDKFAGASAIFNWALTRRMIRERPADQLNWIPSIALKGRKYSFVGKVASPQASFGVRSSRIHFLEMNAWRTNAKGRLRARFLNFVCGRKCLCHVFPLWQILHI